MFKLLDCFCGMGGVSDGFALEGFDVTGIDVVDAPLQLGYKHKFIHADMLKLDGKDFRGYNVIWGSPPCRDFSVLTAPGWKFWKQKPNIKKGLELVNCYLCFVENAKPIFWIMENVPRLRKFIDCQPKQISVTNTPRKRRAFWGNYPAFLMPVETSHIPQEDIQGKNRKWIRAKIPLSCSRAFAKACKEHLKNAAL